MLTCQRNSFTAVAPRPPKLVTDKAPSQTHRPPRCPPGTGLAGPLCLGQTPGSLRARAKRGARLAPRPRAPRQHRDSGAGSCVGRVLVPETQPYLAQGHLSLHTGAPRAAGAGHAAHPRRPLCPFFTLSAPLLAAGGPGRQSPRSPAPRTSEAACAPPPCALGRGLAALPPPRPLSRRGRWSRLPGVARPEPLDSGISHHAAPTRPGPAALCGPGRGRGASPAGLREDTRVRSSWPRPGRAGSPHGREPRATARRAPRPADLAPRAPASASPSGSGLALGPRTCSGVVNGAASGPDPTRLVQRVPACPADARARGQRS